MNVIVMNLLSISCVDCDRSGLPGSQVNVVTHLETRIRKLPGPPHVPVCSKPKRGAHTGSQELQKKMPTCTTSCSHWTIISFMLCCVPTPGVHWTSLNHSLPCTSHISFPPLTVHLTFWPRPVGCSVASAVQPVLPSRGRCFMD